MRTARPPFWERGHALAGAIAIAGLFLPLALTIERDPPPDLGPTTDCPVDRVRLEVPTTSPPPRWHGDDGIFLRDARSLEVLPGAFSASADERVERARARRDEIRAKRSR
jgi:hypothetical protein